MPCEPDLLVGIKMFELLDEDDRIALARVIDEQKLTEGQTLFQAGDPGDSLFIVQAGEIELFDKRHRRSTNHSYHSWPGRHVW